MSQTQIETVGKVFVVVAGKRRCVTCNGMFTPTQAANHGATSCYPHIEARQGLGTPERS
jgi:hypothetical protein